MTHALSRKQIKLQTGVDRLDRVLRPVGFNHTLGSPGSSPGGPFAVATFRRGSLEIGVIVRNGDQLGCPNYSVGEGYAGHQDLIAELGHGGEELLVAGPHLSYVGKNSLDAFDALGRDLEAYVIPALGKSEHAFKDALRRAVAAAQKRLGF